MQLTVYSIKTFPFGDEIPFTQDQIQEEIVELRNKIPGPNRIPAAKKISSTKIFHAIEIYNVFLWFIHFQIQWKNTIIISILQPNTNSKNSTSYRPIPLLNLLGKSSINSSRLKLYTFWTQTISLIQNSSNYEETTQPHTSSVKSQTASKSIRRFKPGPNKGFRHHISGCSSVQATKFKSLYQTHPDTVRKTPRFNQQHNIYRSSNIRFHPTPAFFLYLHKWHPHIHWPYNTKLYVRL